MSIFDSNPKIFDSYRNNSIVISRTLDNGNFHILSKNIAIHKMIKIIK